MTINYTTLLGLAKPVTGTETGQWGDVVNDEITSLLEDAVANAATFSVTSGNVTLTTTNGASNQARMSTLIITGTPGTTRNVVAPSQAKIYQVINQSDGAVVIKGSATTGVTIAAGATGTVVWNGSDFVEVNSTSSGRIIKGNLQVTGNLQVDGNTQLGNATSDTLAVTALVNSNLLFTDNTYDIGASGATRPRSLFLGTNITVGSLTSTRVPYASTGGLLVDSANMTFNGTRLTVADLADSGLTPTRVVYSTTGGALTDSANLTFDGTNLTLGGGTANGVAFLNASKVLTTGSALQFDGSNLGLGVTPSASSSSAKVMQVRNSLFEDNDNGYSIWRYNDYYDGTSDKYIANGTAQAFQMQSGAFKWYTAPSGTAGNAISFTQAMTLGASGELIIGNTTRAQTAKLTIQAVSGSSKFGVGPLETSSTNFFVVNASGTGVYLADGATSWTANSDERLKDIIEPIQNASEKISTLRAVIGKYKTDKDGVRRAFLIAQDVQAVLPEAVVATDPDSLGVMYTDTIPLLVAAIKEQQAIIEQLKADVAALKGN